MWQKIESQHVIDRTWQSMRDRFNKYIVPRTDDEELKQIFGRPEAVLVKPRVSLSALNPNNDDHDDEVEEIDETDSPLPIPTANKTTNNDDDNDNELRTSHNNNNNNNISNDSNGTLSGKKRSRSPTTIALSDTSTQTPKATKKIVRQLLAVTDDSSEMQQQQQQEQQQQQDERTTSTTTMTILPGVTNYMSTIDALNHVAYDFGKNDEIIDCATLVVDQLSQVICMRAPFLALFITRRFVCVCRRRNTMYRHGLRCTL
jgi:hypothetical protein